MDIKEKPIENTALAYIAGLIDGEGTITLTRLHRSQNRQLVVSISSTEKPMLDYVHNVVKAGKIISKKNYQEHHSASFAYSITNRQALVLLEQIQPYLKSYKAKRAEIILRDYIKLTPRNGYYTEQLKLEREKFELAVLNIKP